MKDARETGNDAKNAMNSLVPVGKTNRYQRGCQLASAWQTNRYQWMSKAPGEKPGVLERGHWSRYAGTGWKTVTYGRFQPVLKAGFPVVWTRFFF